MAAPEADWGTCRFCGGAVPPNGPSCPTCGERDQPVRPRDYARLTPRQRRWMGFVKIARVAVVVGVAVGIAVAILSAVWTGPPVYPDPLTTRGSLVVTPGNFTYLSGWITGEDYIDGNFTVTYPVGVPIDFSVFNSTEFGAFLTHHPAATIAAAPNATQSRIVFAAPYTDTFYLVFENPYPASSGITVTIYEVTNYQTNVVIG
ncbi:MAG TPA: hypothetical protein VLX64_02320 [Thermoplasmata archaeon]|nr:hypothetical protein [Thermoplasmata archaeon]